MIVAIKTKVRVLIIDDSAIVRKILSRQLDEYSGIEVVGRRDSNQ